MAAAEDAPKRTDFSRSFQAAEEAASVTIDAMLTEGGRILWGKYIDHKAFGFAKDSATGTAVAHLEMCFVAHDEGEEAMNEKWDIEPEPQPKKIDSWARMHLPTQKRVPGEDDARLQPVRKARQPASRPSAGRQKGGNRKELRSDQRMFALPDEMPIEEEEERLRREKAEERQRIVEKDKNAKQAENEDKAQEKVRQAMLEEMEKKPHTIDMLPDGTINIIWIEEPRRPPPLQDAFPFAVRRVDPRRTMDASQLQSMMPQGGSAGQPQAKGKAKAKARGRQRTELQHEFTDAFTKLQDGQPPILETMAVKAGVTLEAQGMKSIGPDLPDAKRTMSRKEYVQLAERELAGEGGTSQSGASKGGQATSTDGGSVGGPGGGASSILDGLADGGGGGGGGGGLGGDLAATGGGSGGTTLPPIASSKSAAPLQRTGGAGQGMRNMNQQDGLPVDEKKIKGLVPPVGRMRDSFNAVGNLPRPPRYHQPSLGGIYGGAAQPPIGATMGHGLVQSGSLKESFFYPPQTPVLPPALLKAASEGVLRRDGTGNSQPNTPKVTPGRAPRSFQGGRPPSSRGDYDQDGGAIKGDKKSTLFRNVLQSMSDRPTSMA